MKEEADEGNHNFTFVLHLLNVREPKHCWNDNGGHTLRTPNHMSWSIAASVFRHFAQSGGSYHPSIIIPLQVLSLPPQRHYPLTGCYHYHPNVIIHLQGVITTTPMSLSPYRCCHSHPKMLSFCITPDTKHNTLKIREIKKEKI